MSEGLSMIYDTLDKFSGKQEWELCCKGECAEGYDGICNLRNVKRDYPEDGICYEPLEQE